MEIPYFVLNEKINETFLEEDNRTEVEEASRSGQLDLREKRSHQFDRGCCEQQSQLHSECGGDVSAGLW